MGMGCAVKQESDSLVDRYMVLYRSVYTIRQDLQTFASNKFRTHT